VHGVRDFIRDFRYALRALLNSPLTTTVSVLALALGVGANAALFISINSLILHPLPYPRLDRIMMLWGTPPRLDTQRTALSAADFTDLAREARSFQAVAAYRDWDASLTGIGNPERLDACQVSAGFFDVLGTPARLGRTLSSGDDTPARSDVVVISEGFWRSHLAAMPSAIGKTLVLNRRKYTIVGVMPERFNFPLETDLWAPLALDTAASGDRETHNLLALGLLKPGVSAPAARAEVEAIASRLADRYPRADDGRGMLVVPLRDFIDTVTNHFLWTLLGAAGFVLLLACANVANLQLARSTGREKETAVRAALGASRLRIARQILAEGILIALGAGVAGLLFASWNNDLGKRTIPAVALRSVPGLRDLRIDSTVVLLTFGTALAAGVVCSLPAIVQCVNRRLRGDLNDLLRGRSDSGGLTPRRNGLRTALIVCELALALVLLVGAGLMVKTFDRFTHLNQGFDPKNVLSMQVSLPKTEYSRPAQVTGFYDGLLNSLATVHNVTAAAVDAPLGVAEMLLIEGRPEPRPGEPRPAITAVSSRYFEALRIPILEGRAIADRDRPGAQRVVVVSRSLAQHYWPGASAIGRRIRFDKQSDWLAVVGVSSNVIEDWFREMPAVSAYVSYAQFPSPAATILARTSGDPMLAAPGARAAVRGIDRDLPVYDVKPMVEVEYEARGGVRAAALSMTTYAAIALLLAVTGIYAVVSYSVASRTHDIGVHMALGANRADVLRMIMRQAGFLTGIGLLIGLPLAIALARVMSSALYNTVNLEPSTFVVFAGILIGAALAASYLPARRATRIEPITALRNE
jgi:putative ABC transport system permease protein